MRQTDMNSDVMIDIRGISKRYTIGQIGGATLQHEIQSWWAQKLGKDDPNRMIGDERMRGDTFYALKDIDLLIRKGETVGIIGRNGAGKSTLLKLISRVTAPTTGSIDIYGRLTSMLEVGTGFDGEMTGRENVYLNGTILGMTRAEITSKMDDIIDFADLRDFIDTPVKRYSSGMYIKLGFSVAMHLDSEIMIMDEVLAVGDQAFQNKCIEVMKQAARSEGRTILYVSHNMNQIRQLCDRCIVLEDGRIIFSGDTEEAVALYLNQSFRESLRLEYQDHPRPFWLDDDRLRILSAEFPERDIAVFHREEVPRVRMLLKCSGHIDRVCLRIELRDISDRRIGVYILYDLFDCEPGELRVFEAEYGIPNLAEGKYNVVYNFFERDRLGNNHNLDNVPGLSFQVTVREKDGEVHWDKKEWGYIQFRDCRVTESRIVSRE